MKTILLTSLLMISCWARAEQNVTLSFNNVMLTSQEKGAAMIDLTAEIKKQSPSTRLSGQRLKSVEVDGKASFLGATVILLVSGQALDSQTLESGDTQPVVLSHAFPRTPGAWTLGIRGQLSLQQIKIVLDDEDAKAAVELDPLVRNDMNNAPTSAPSADPARPAQGGNTDSSGAYFTVGETLIAVSSISGLIDYVTFLSDDGDGTYTIQYDDQAIPRWTRNQLAKTSGCNLDICVGQAIDRGDDTYTVAGLLTGDRFVVQRSNRRFLVMNRSNLKPARAETPAPVRTPKPVSNGRYQVGQKILLVLDARQVYAGKVQDIGSGGTVVALDGGRSLRATRADQIAVLSGCTRGFCVGDSVDTYSSNGRMYSARIVGLQSNAYAVLSFNGQRGYVGYWPIEALQK